MKKQFKVIIAGGRDFSNYELLKAKMDNILANVSTDFNISIINGTAAGADSLGGRYAKEKGYGCIKMPANWNKYGNSAGYKRNVEMANIANAVVVFWDGKSRGSKHMIDIAKQKNLPLRIVKY